MKENLLQFFEKFNNLKYDKDELIGAIKATQQSHNHIQMIAMLCKNIYDKIVH